METNKVTELVLENIEKLLIEGRLENIKKKYPNTSWDIIDSLANADPSKTNKFLEWSVKNYMNGRTIKWFKDNANSNSGYYNWTAEEVPDTAEDPRWDEVYALRRNAQTSLNTNKLSLLKDNLEHFSKNPSKYEVKDINQFKSAQEFEDAVEIAKQKLSRKEMKETGVDKVFEDDRFILMMPKTHKAACRYGSRTRWCVTMRGYSGYFESYFGQGPIFFLIDKAQPEKSYSPQYMYTAPDYWKVAIHYRPFNGRLNNSGSVALSKAQQMTKEQFMDGANLSNTTIDYWNVQDDNKKESVVGKYLGGPGRGQTQRAEAILNQLKSVMERYTKKVMGDYYDSLELDDEVTKELSDLQSERYELNQKKSSMYYKRDRLNLVRRNLSNFSDRLDSEGSGDDEYREWCQKQIEQCETYLEKMQNDESKMSEKLAEMDERIEKLQEKINSTGLVFYDKEKNVPMNR